MARDLTPPAKRSAADLDALAEITPDDLLHAQETANRLTTPRLEQLLKARPDDGEGNSNQNQP